MKTMMMEEARNIKRKKMSKNDKRRFSDEQIRRLELMFESDTKLEPRKKVEVARELGLQPRQVAIWFQNKRARWKSKHIEKEYSSLLASYNTLASQFDSLNKEKQSLLLQLQKVKKESEGARCGSSDGESWECNSKTELEVKNEDSSVENVELLQENDELLRMSDWGNLDSDDIIINHIHTAAIANQWWDFSSFID